MRAYRLYGSFDPEEQYRKTPWRVQSDDHEALEVEANKWHRLGVWSWWRIVDTATGETYAEQEY